MVIHRLEVRASNLMFDVDACGMAGMPMVLLLHGFPQTSHAWRHALPVLGEAGFWAVAPNQRGYSAGARPQAVAAYDSELLVNDVLEIAAALGAEQFHLVGHDWGGQLAWLIAARHRQRVRSLAVLSRPHPAAFAEAMRIDPAQARRSGHHQAFQDPSTAKRLLEDGARRLRSAFEGVAVEDIDAYLERLGNESALNAALNWYRSGRSDGSSPLAAADVPAVSVPTLYVWGDADASVGRVAAESTARYVTGIYRFAVIEGAGHFLTDEAVEPVTALLLEHIANNR
jgi:pimeloyl-ACP methyl ester carboxylesterase